MKKTSRSARFIIENVRCFAERQSLEIRPLTFLVGENSTGKSTILGSMQAFLNESRNYPSVDFNIPPYQMGSFSDIVRKNAKPPIDNFQLGIQFDTPDKKGMECIAKFREKREGSEAILQEFDLQISEGKITFKRGEEGKFPITQQSLPGTNVKNFTITLPNIDFFLPSSPSPFAGRFFYKWHFLLDIDNFQKNVEKKQKAAYQEFRNFIDKIMERKIELAPIFRSLYSFAPVRSRPERTYNPLRESYDPEGANIPVLLKNLYTTKKEKWEELRKKLIRFGRASGLFSDIDIKDFGKSNDPFQLIIKVQGPKANIVDVGYGVSQILPILIGILSDRKKTFLLQQPEVHLHPRAQAELASLLVQLTKEPGHNFIIETHSEYMVNRASIEIRRGNLAPEELSLIYLEPMGAKGVRAHNISFNKKGEIQDPPEGYGKFFLAESNRFLGFSE